jgi:hypothetical protein
MSDIRIAALSAFIGMALVAFFAPLFRAAAWTTAVWAVLLGWEP